MGVISEVGKMLKLTILVENTVRQCGLLAEHGLSIWLENDQNKVLFDAGQTDVFVRNAAQLGIDLKQAQSIVLSHGHYDHGGGIPHFPSANHAMTLVIHPDSLLPRFSLAPKPVLANRNVQQDNPSQPDQPPRSIGLPWQLRDISRLGIRVIENRTTREIGHNLYVCSGVVSTNDFEVPQSSIVIEQDGRLVPDAMAGEQMLVCTCPHGLVVLLGCAHPGVVNCLEQVRRVFGSLPILGVVGGMHLEQVSPERLKRTLDYFDQLKIRRIVPLHCTGRFASQALYERLGDRVIFASTGDQLVFNSNDFDSQ